MKRILIVLLLLTLVLTGCGGGEEPADEGNQEYSDVLSVALRGEPSSLDPHLNTQLVSEAVRREIYDFLVVKDETGSIQPSVATSWENIDDTTIRFHLRDDVVFHNGEKLTAEDVRFTLIRASEKSGSAPLFKVVDAEGTAVVDEYTVDLKLTEPFAPIFNYLSAPEGGILCKSAVEELGDDAFGRSPIGSGPLMLKDWVTGTSLELSRNEDYWGDKPTYKTLIVKFISEPANRTIELETGGVDVIYDVSTNDIARIQENEVLNLISGTGLKYTYITLNMKDETLKDARVREALACSLDLESMVDAVYTGTSKVADSVMSSNIFAYKAIGSIPYDVEKAKTLLAEAGYENGLDVVAKCYDDATFINILEIAQNMWKEAGINADVRVMEYATFDEQGAKGEVQIGVSAFTASTADPDQALGLWSTDYNSLLQGTDLQIDQYLKDGRSTYDDAERIAIYGEAQQYMWDTHYMIPLAYSDVIYATTNKVEGLECHPGNTPNLAKVVVYK